MPEDSMVAAVRKYLAAWNAHDAGAIVAAFADGGTYTDPTLSTPLAGDAIGEHAAGRWQAFPDLEFDVERIGHVDGDTVGVEWVLSGTQDGPFGELPPTGETVELPGTDLVEVGGDGLAAVDGYFDQATLFEQLGLRVDVQPERLGPIRFGTSTRLDLGRTAEPGAFSLTAISFRDEADADAVTQRGRAVEMEMAEMDGVVSVLTTRDRERAYTVTAWEDPAAARQLMRGGAHLDAARDLFARDGVGTAATTGIYTPERVNGRILRCEACGRTTYSVEADTCPDCGAPLPPAPPYW